jgi:hypothetical protein
LARRLTGHDYALTQTAGPATVASAGNGPPFSSELRLATQKLKIAAWPGSVPPPTTVCSGLFSVIVVSQITERVAAYRKRDVVLIVAGFLHLQQGAEVGGSRIPPLVREIEDSEEDSLGEPVLVSV